MIYLIIELPNPTVPSHWSSSQTEQPERNIILLLCFMIFVATILQLKSTFFPSKLLKGILVLVNYLTCFESAFLSSTF